MKKIIITFLSLTLTASAFWPAGGVKVVQTSNHIWNPQMVYLNDGSVIVSWETDRLYCQKLDTTGAILWGVEGVRVSLSDSAQRDHHMVTDGEDVWLVWWRHDGTVNGNIYAQKIDGSNGQRIWGDKGKAVCIKEGDQWYPTGTNLSSGDFVITWDAYDVDTNDVTVQWFNSDGTPLWEINGSSIGKGSAYKSYVLPSGEAVVDVWLGLRPGDTTAAYLAQRVDCDRNLLWGSIEVLIEYVAHSEGVCSDNTGGAIVLFNKLETYDLAVQRIDSSGQVLWSAGGVTLHERSSANRYFSQTTFPPYMDWANLISDSNGGCFVWFTKDKNLIVQHVDSSGQLLWGSEGAICKSFSYCEESRDPVRLCKDGEGGLMVAYDNMFWNCEYPPYQDTGRFGLYVQRIDSEGAPMFDSSGVAVFKGEDVWYGPSKWFRYAVGVPGGVMVTWLDNRNSPDNSLYVQILDTTGKVGSDITERPPTTQYSTFEVLTSVGNQIVLRFADASGSQPGSVAVFDATGRLVDKIRVPAQGGTVTWPVTLGAGFSPGVYFFTEAQGSVTLKAVLIK